MGRNSASVGSLVPGALRQSKIRRLHASDPEDWVPREPEPGHELGRKSKIGCVLTLAVVWTASLFGQEIPRHPHDLTSIYVPADDFAAILSRDKRGVFLPRSEFAALLEKARQNARETPEIPEGIAVAGALHRATIVGNQLVLTSSLELNQVAHGWRSLRLPVRGIAVEAARLDGKPALLAR